MIQPGQVTEKTDKISEEVLQVKGNAGSQGQKTARHGRS
jgi:hypothetical protein